MLNTYYRCVLIADRPRDVVLGGYATQPDGVKNIAQYETLTCNATGYPAVTYTWQWFDGVSIQVSYGSVLNMTLIGLRNYTCIANNSLGSQAYTAEIAVTGMMYTPTSIHLFCCIFVTQRRRHTGCV